MAGFSRYDDRPWRKLYKTKKWADLRNAQLGARPLCEYCEGQGYLTPATVVDHIIAHKGDEILFHDPENLRSLCKPHHDGTKQREEKSQVIIGGDKDGTPIDPNHHWNN